MYLGNPGVESAHGSTTLGGSYSQMRLVKMHSTSYQNFLTMPVGLRPLLLNTRKQLPFEIFAAKRRRSTLRKDEDFKGASPVRPPSLFVKQSPIPTRRPLRCAPFPNVLSQSVNEPEQGKRVKTSKEVVTKALSGAEDSVENNMPKKEEQVQLKEKADRVSKWASLFEAASTSTNETATTTETKDADAWFDKIFPKNVNQPKEGDVSAPPKLSPQQEKSIQQLQTLVKTLGVATRNPAPPTRRNKPNKIRPLSLQGGVDPVPFSSILRKLQSVSQQETSERSKLEGVVESRVASETQVLEKRESSKPATREAEDDIEEDEESSEEDDSEVEEDEEVEDTRVAQAEKSGQVPREPTVPGVSELSKLTVVALRNMAKAKGLSGYSRLKKDDLVQLLAKSGN